MGYFCKWYSTLYYSNLAEKLNICLHHFDVQRKIVSPLATHKHTPSNLKKSIILTTYMPSFCNFASNPDPAKRPHLQETDVTSEKEVSFPNASQPQHLFSRNIPSPNPVPYASTCSLSYLQIVRSTER